MSNFDDLISLGLGSKAPKSIDKSKHVVEARAVPKAINKTCKKCGAYLKQDGYYEVDSYFFPDGYADICKNCLDNFIDEEEEEAGIASFIKVCQYLDIEYDLNEWMRISEEFPKNKLSRYMNKFWKSETINSEKWRDLTRRWETIIESKREKEELDSFKTEEMERLIDKWGHGFSKEQMIRFDKMYDDIERTQSITTAIQKDNAKKMCMLSTKIEQAIWETDEEGKGKGGAEVKALIGAYDQLAKAADFTPKAAKNVGDFESVGELCAFLEKKGFMNEFYDWKPRDEVDTVMENLQKYVRRVILGETNIADELNSKLDQIQAMNDAENSDLSLEEEEVQRAGKIDEALADEYHEEMEI